MGDVLMLCQPNDMLLNPSPMNITRICFSSSLFFFALCAVVVLCLIVAKCGERLTIPSNRYGGPSLTIREHIAYGWVEFGYYDAYADDNATLLAVFFDTNQYFSYL